MRGLLIVLLALAITSGLFVLARNWLASRAPRGQWQLQERSDGELLTLHAVRPGDEPLLLGAAPIAAEDFDSKLYELRAQAREKVSALNARP